MNNRTIPIQSTFSANWANVILGIWVAISPFVLAATRLPSATWDAVVVGLAVALIALTRTLENHAVGGINVLLGLWLIASPFVLGVAAASFFWSLIICGALIAIAALVAVNSPSRRVPPSLT